MADSALKLFYEFALNKSLESSFGLGPTPGIVRTTERRVFGADGLLKTVAAGEAGFGNEPVKGEYWGLN